MKVAPVKITRNSSSFNASLPPSGTQSKRFVSNASSFIGLVNFTISPTIRPKFTRAINPSVYIRASPSVLPTVAPTTCVQPNDLTLRKIGSSPCASRSGPNLSPEFTPSSTVTPPSYAKDDGELSLVERISQTRTLRGLRRIDANGDQRRLAALFTERYLPWHRRHRYNRATRRLIFQLRGPHPGLGDRLTGMISALGYAVVTRRLLLVDWVEPFSLEEVLSTRISSIYVTKNDFVFTPPSTWFCPNGTYITSMLQSKAHTIFYNATSPMKAVGLLRLIRKYGRADDIAYVQNVNDTALGMGSDGSVFGLMLNGMLRPSRDFADFLGTQAGTLLQGNFVAVHARLGKGVLEGGKRFVNVDSNCVARMLAETGIRIAKEEKVPNAALFLATDTPTFRPLFDRVGARMGAKKIFKALWDTKHVARMEKNNEQDRKLFWLSMVDLILISRASAVVGMGSRFANVGAFVGGMDAHVAIGLHGECGSWVIGAGMWR